jgi:Putative adhesin/Domain of unknown function (DUF5668)
MSVSRSAGAIFWGLTLVAIGILLLAYNMGYPIHIWPYIARYWPALLIAWGLLKVVDYFRFRRAGDSRPLFSGGEVVLLIFVIFAGSAITTAANLSPNIGNIFEIGDIDLWDITGDNYTYDQHIERENVLPDSEIEIVNYFGDVDVRPAESERIVVDAKKTIRAGDKNEADRLDRDFTFSIEGDGSNYRIISNRDSSGFRGSPRQRFKSSLVIRLPRRSAVHLNNRNGRIVLEDLTGNQAVVNRYGDIDVRNVTGKLDLENRNGGVTVQDVTESVVINNRYSNTTVKNIGGDLQIDTRNGSVDVSGVKGSVRVNNSYAPINVQNVQGELTITGRNNSVDVEHVEGDIRADSSYQNVTIRDPRGAVTVTSRNGDLLLSFERAPEKNVAIESRYANVTLELPSNSAFKIDARTAYGDVYSEFEGVNIDRTNRDRMVRGEVGRGGPQFTISTRNGAIRLQKRG